MFDLTGKIASCVRAYPVGPSRSISEIFGIDLVEAILLGLERIEH
jgi:hypothetical protein